MPQPTCDMSWRILEDNTIASRFTAVRRTISTETGNSPSGKEGRSDAIRVGNTNHDAIDMESTTIASTVDRKKPLHIMPDRALSGSMISEGSLDRV
mmetsp:Transcript_8955/g.16177  ORF Transcript_8955/g.16177 Transcript_8955/m.16177 type:complete len:96 (+) Transcript_8955:301-588(+)